MTSQRSSLNITDVRRHVIPVIYVRGNHYDVGYDIGRTFSANIQETCETSELLNDRYLPCYNTPEGFEVYNNTLAVLKTTFPQYLNELQGIADGANVEFHKLLLFHLDEILPNVVTQRNSGEPIGCTSVYVNGPEDEVLGHAEDCCGENLNTFYIVSAHIISDKPEGKHGVKEERFTSLCYAGQLPGYTMSYNYHGLVCSINTLVARTLNEKKTPRHFLARALLAAQNYDQALKILKDCGVGAADACSINLTFINASAKRQFYNIELGPALPDSNESQIDVLTVGPGENSFHCNNFLRLKVLEFDDYYMNSTKFRMKTLKKFANPNSLHSVIQMLGDQTGEFWIFRDKPGMMKTICVGIFDLKKRTWSLYKENPKTNDPIVVLHMVIKD